MTNSLTARASPRRHIRQSPQALQHADNPFLQIHLPCLKHSRVPQARTDHHNSRHRRRNRPRSLCCRNRSRSPAKHRLNSNRRSPARLLLPTSPKPRSKPFSTRHPHQPPLGPQPRPPLRRPGLLPVVAFSTPFSGHECLRPDDRYNGDSYLCDCR